MAAVLLTPAPALAALVTGIPKAFERAVHKCLEKDLTARYQTAAELLANLRSLRSGETMPGAAPPAGLAARRVPRAALAIVALITMVAIAYFAWPTTTGRDLDSLAVLPFTVTGASDAEYVGDGLAESLITALTRVPTLRVKSRSLAFQHRGRDAEAQAVARALDVDAVLTGRAVFKGTRVIVSAELVDAADSSLLWSDQFDRPGSDLIGVYEAISRGVAERLRPALNPQDQGRVSRRDTVDPEAYRLYLRGRFHWSKLNPEGWVKGGEYFQQAIERDAAYARAYAGLADSYNLRGLFGLLTAHDAFPRAKQAATRALQIDPAIAEAHTSLGIVAFYYDWDWETAERELRQATASDPDYAYGHNFRGIFLAAMGRSDEALVEGRRAEELEPLSTLNATNLGLMFYFARRFDEAVAQFRRALELDPTYFTAYFWMGNALAQSGRDREALAALDEAHRLSGGQPIVLAAQGYVHGHSGNRRMARALLDRLEAAAARQHVPAYFFAIVHHSLGDNDEAFRWLNRAYDERSPWMPRLKVEPWMDGLRNDPRFSALMQRVSRTW
jgi:TolB-like protein/Tfp pilus assembly protein PilF